jgi:hypothetical protein
MHQMFAASSKTEEVSTEGLSSMDADLSPDQLQLVSGGLTSVAPAASLASASLSIFNGASACKNNSQRTSGF